MKQQKLPQKLKETIKVTIISIRLFPNKQQEGRCREALLEHFRAASLEELGLEETGCMPVAAGALLHENVSQLWCPKCAGRRLTPLTGTDLTIKEIEAD